MEVFAVGQMARKQLKKKGALTTAQCSVAGEVVGPEETTCKMCFKTFLDNAALCAHYKTHFNQKEYPCNLCDKSFSTRHSRSSHKSAVHRNPTIPCDREGCGELFVNRSLKEQHVKQVHVAQEETFSCEFCDFRCTRANSLKHHEMYKCSKNPSFKFHKKRPQCSFCGERKFASVAILNAHLKRKHKKDIQDDLNG